MAGHRYEHAEADPRTNGDIETTPDTPHSKAHAEAAIEDFLTALGLDDDDEHLEDTPHRIAKSRINELFSGLWEDPREHLATTFDADGHDELVVVDNLDVKSMCAHHFLPFTGKAHVGYIPDGDLVGLSKFSRVVEGYARRPQVQERLTEQIADAIHEELQPKAVFVLAECDHECMTLRGVEQEASVTRTTAYRGEASEDAELREEFHRLADGGF